MPLALMLIGGGVLLLWGGLTGEHPWSPVVTAFGGTPPPPPGGDLAAVASGAGAAAGDAITSSVPVVAGGNPYGPTIVGTARSYDSARYLLGSESHSAIDCSGLSQVSYAAAGLSLPRTAALQRAVSKPVNDPSPGDLVFFWATDGVVFHVGIITDAAGKNMIESAPSHSGVAEVPVTYQGFGHVICRPAVVIRAVKSGKARGRIKG